MSSKVRNKSSKKQKELSEVLLREKKTEDKENKYSSLRLKRKNLKEPVKSQGEEVKLKELHESLSSTSKPGVEVKTLGFWYKKLQDLEESLKKNKECGLYDFNESDESDFCYKKKKKIKQKAGLLKKKRLVASEYNKPAEKIGKMYKPEKQIKEIHRQSLCREKIILNKERKKLAEKGKNFTFSTGMPSLGITSTPAVNKDNLVGASNFLFLSPVIKENAKPCSSINQTSPLNEKIIDNDLLIVSISQETPKVKTRLNRISCKRVLRNGKILNT